MHFADIEILYRTVLETYVACSKDAGKMQDYGVKIMSIFAKGKTLVPLTSSETRDWETFKRIFIEANVVPWSYYYQRVFSASEERKEALGVEPPAQISRRMVWFSSNDFFVSQERFRDRALKLKHWGTRRFRDMPPTSPFYKPTCDIVRGAIQRAAGTCSRLG